MQLRDLLLSGCLKAALFPEAQLKVSVTHAEILGWYDSEFGRCTNGLTDLSVYVHGVT